MNINYIIDLIEDSSINDFKISNNTKIILKSNQNITIEKDSNDFKTNYNIEHFFDSNDKAKENLSSYDNLLLKFCELDNTRGCCSSIYSEVWHLKDNNRILKRFDLLNFFNPSSINFRIPKNIENKNNFEFFICKILNKNSLNHASLKANDILENI